MRKGQTREMLEILLLVVGVSILISIFHFFFSSKLQSLKLSTVETHEYERLMNSIINIFYSKVPGVEKVIAQLLADMVANQEEMVEYGEEYGGVNITAIIEDYFNQIFDEGWRLEVRDGKAFVFGFKEPINRRIRTVVFKLPIPSKEGKCVDIVLKEW